ncbi:hypothetical protein HZ326_3471 [Fusarium oxysporum f. sp. albedinis]|nr:hypothetical protein HZ326_3471 [Fusarium oxysporum f. sp. albedinis]
MKLEVGMRTHGDRQQKSLRSLRLNACDVCPLRVAQANAAATVRVQDINSMLDAAAQKEYVVPHSYHGFDCILMTISMQYATLTRRC